MTPRLHAVTAYIVLACSALVAGCGEPGRSYPVEPEKARQALRSTLDAWKEGKTPDDLRRWAPEVVAQDRDWKGGSRLIDYRLLDDGEALDDNLRVQVELTLRDPEGKERKKTVFYVITTRPAITVFRDSNL
jgi:hypothetical protein